LQNKEQIREKILFNSDAFPPWKKLSRPTIPLPFGNYFMAAFSDAACTSMHIRIVQNFHLHLTVKSACLLFVIIVTLFRVYVHSFIHCMHLYSASSSGTTQKRFQLQRGRIMLF